MSGPTDRLTGYGPWAVVTGATSGIGRAIAGELARAGLGLVLVARDGAALAAVRDELGHGVDALVVAADLATADGVAAVTAATAGLDVGLLVSAAGFGTSGACVDSDPATELSMLDVNCRATYLLSREFGARFARRGRGGLVLFGSIVGYQGAPGAAHYAATKAYVQTLGEGLHRELRAAGVDVLVSSPGPVHTGFARRAGMSTGRTLQPGDVAVAPRDGAGDGGHDRWGLPFPRAVTGEDGPVRAVVSRVGTAAVTVDGVVVGEIGPGLLSLVGVGTGDDGGRARALARKMHELRIFPGADGAVSAADLGLPLLVVSQFTLYADTRKGRRPSWQDAAPADVAEPLVDEVVAELRRRGASVATGVFGARMQVSSVNEGPMTLLLET